MLIGWIAAPHDGVGLPAVLRTAAALWLVGQHVGFTLRGAGRIGMLPLGLVLLPGALLWRAAGGSSGRPGPRLRHVGYAALALAVPYSLLTGCARAGQQFGARVVVGAAVGRLRLLLALAAGGLGGARALAPWPSSSAPAPGTASDPSWSRSRAHSAPCWRSPARCWPAWPCWPTPARGGGAGARPRRRARSAPCCCCCCSSATCPNAVIWAIAFCRRPWLRLRGRDVVAPTGSALGQLPAVPAAGRASAGAARGDARLARADRAGAAVPGGRCRRRAAGPGGAGARLDAAPLLGPRCGAVSGGSARPAGGVSGGPLGDGRLAAVGPSGWQVGARGGIGDRHRGSGHRRRWRTIAPLRLTGALPAAAAPAPVPVQHRADPAAEPGRATGTSSTWTRGLVTRRASQRRPRAGPSALP